MYPPLYQSSMYESTLLSTYLRWSQRVKASPAKSPLPALWWLEKTLTAFVVVAVVQSLSRVRLCHPLDCSTPSFPVLHYLLEFAQTHVHWVSDAIQPSHALLSPSPFGLLSFPASGSFPLILFFTSGGQNIGASVSASVLPMNIQDWFPLALTCLISLLSKKFSSLTHVLLGNIHSLLYLCQIYVNNLIPMCSLFSLVFSFNIYIYENPSCW